MDINYKEIAGKAVAYAKANNIELDFSKESIKAVDNILGYYNEHINEYSGEEGANRLWNIAVHFGIYIGETLLKIQLQSDGYDWFVDDGLPILKKDKGNNMSPITKAHKRILNGAEDSVKSFCDIALMIGKGEFPTKNVYRVIDVKLASGKEIKNVSYHDIDDYIMMVEYGDEDFIILNSSDGFLQFYGVANQYIAEVWINFADGDFRSYSFINSDKKDKLERISFSTPYGDFTPMERDIVSLDLIRRAVEEYYKDIDIQEFLKNFSVVETTQEMKELMGGKK